MVRRRGGGGGEPGSKTWRAGWRSSLGAISKTRFPRSKDEPLDLVSGSKRDHAFRFPFLELYYGGRALRGSRD